MRIGTRLAAGALSALGLGLLAVPAVAHTVASPMHLLARSASAYATDGRRFVVYQQGPAEPAV
jgi:hypothetical protein